jgi:hypothetical protein
VNNSFPPIEIPDIELNKLGINKLLFHQQYLQIRGIYIPERITKINYNNEILLSEAHVRLKVNNKGAVEKIPMKIPIFEAHETPYSLKNNKLFFLEKPLDPDIVIEEIPLPEKGKPRHLKGYSLPFIGTNNPFIELRINPKNTGHCPGRCMFCHRPYSHRLKPVDSRVLAPVELVNRIINHYGKDIFQKVERVKVITELFGKESIYLDYIQELYSYLIKNG